MAITITSGPAVWTTAAGAKTSSSFTPNAGDLIILFELQSAVDAASTITDSQSGSYVQVGSAYSHSTTVAGQIRLWVRTTTVTATAMTVTVTPGGTSTGGGFKGYCLSGVSGTGAAAIRQTGGVADQATGTPSVAFGTGAALTANACFGAVVTNTNSTTNTAPPTGWIEDTDLGYATPATGIEVARSLSG